MKSVIRVGNNTKRQQKTDIGHSPLTRFRSKRKKRHANKIYRGQGKPLWPLIVASAQNRPDVLGLAIGGSAAEDRHPSPT